ncbi:LysR family transcriptional regulator [Kitasatospora sp. NPDC051914]|uniref:LysR family transcriptional regulator n=1 Tax=unclassified Kitasatospora TaxID=2633591 RepID=UPI00341645D6
MDIDVKTLRTFCEVIRTGSFTSAAHRLGYSQSSVTAQMRALERQVGAPVFHRLPNGVRLTPAGSTLRGYAGQLLTLVDEMEHALRGPSATVPRLKVGLVPALAYGEQLARIAQFGRRLLPGVQLALRVMGTAEIHAALRAGGLDGAILLTGRDHRAAAPVAALTAAPGRAGARARTALLAERASAVRERPEAPTEIAVQDLEFTPSTSAAARPPLSCHQVVVADPDCPSQRWLPEFLRLRGGETPESLELGSMDGVHATVQAGLGCAMLPTGLAAQPYGASLAPIPGVPRMHWTVSLLAARGKEFREGHRQGLADAIRLALTCPA